MFTAPEVLVRRRHFPKTLLLATIASLVMAAGKANAGDDSAALGPSLIGIDHVPTAVVALERAGSSYERLGFSLKPGRAHANGLRNRHVKFKDGSGIELISPPNEPIDPLARTYSEFLRDGDGPAYVSFHARDTDALVSALDKAKIPYERDGGLYSPSDPHLDFLFFVKDNRSPTDMPEHFAHPNTAYAMSEIWLALDDTARARMSELMRALGARKKRATAFVPNAVRADIYMVQNGRVIVVPKNFALRKNGAILGVKFRVRDMRVAKRYFGDKHIVSPGSAHGLWLSVEP